MPAPADSSSCLFRTFALSDMQNGKSPVVLLAGGKGSRLAEETAMRPKPMVEIGGRPILWHIMNIYAMHGFADFIVACGYKGEIIKQYFDTFLTHNTDFIIDLGKGSRRQVGSCGVNWKVGLFDTGLETMTGGRLLRLRSHLEGERFMVTYGDGVGDIDISALLAFHREHGRLATVTAVRPPARFGALALDGCQVRCFSEKPQTSEGWINGGYFVFEPEIFDYFDDDATILEHEPLERLAAEGQLMAYRHPGFWQPMDTLREKLMLEEMWSSGRAPWRIWQ